MSPKQQEALAMLGVFILLIALGYVLAVTT